MEDQLVSLETAKLAKEKNINLEYCNCGGYPDCICLDKRPTQSLLQKYLREEHEIHAWAEQKAAYYFPRVGSFKKGNSIGKPYEEALEIALQEALKLIK